MNKQIKFRAWDKVEKHFWYFTLQEILERRESYRGSFDETILSEEKMQFTGLKDKNKMEIYNGDIVKATNRIHEDWTKLFKVSFINGCYMFENWNAHEFFNKHTNIEMVGNEFENPELLNGGEEQINEN